MAQLALPPGTARRRAAFGLLDADGWGWASIKATFWFMLIIFLLGYLPNLAYYFTVGNTIDVGYNAIPLVNLCDAGNDRAGRKIPCPAPPGTVTPWDPNPEQLRLPAGRAGALAVQSGAHLYLVGGQTATGATNEVLTTSVSSDGNFGVWTTGPALPEPRSDAALATLSGVPYIIGGLDASGAPTSTVFVGELKEGVITGWALADGSTQGIPDLALPGPLSSAAAVAASNGIFIIGGQTPSGPSATVWHAALGTGTAPTLGKFEELSALPLPEPRAGATAVLVGNYLFVNGGEGPNGPSERVYRLTLEEGEPAAEPDGSLLGWATPLEGKPGNLPAPRSHAISFTANGSLYVIGGTDGTGAPQRTNYWAVPNATTGDITSWSHSDATDLPEGRDRSAVSAVGSTAFLIAGEGPTGPVDGTFRAGLSPKPPFFRLGLFGATIPALSIKGEIGQQLGYINAMGVGMTNFAILVIIGIAFSHRAQTMRLVERMSRGRVRAPREDDSLP
ncbi:MAG: hypothetical protein QOH61_1251 [Chloroflexota bacterium]|jgi:hypothetical protein|nr:hypothetical protein [Chloroflexota bacterium]